MGHQLTRAGQDAAGEGSLKPYPQYFGSDDPQRLVFSSSVKDAPSPMIWIGGNLPVLMGCQRQASRRLSGQLWLGAGAPAFYKLPPSTPGPREHTPLSILSAVSGCPLQGEDPGKDPAQQGVHVLYMCVCEWMLLMNKLGD